MHINNQQQRILITAADEEIIIVIEHIALDDKIGLECMSKFCIESFYNNNNNNNISKSENHNTETAAGILAKRWRIFKLLALQKLQLLEIFLSSYNTEFNRCIFVAKALTPITLSSDEESDDNDGRGTTPPPPSYHEEIVGCCEVIAEGLDLSLPQQQQQQQQQSSTEILGSKSKQREQRRRKSNNARHRPIIENLCVKRNYQRMGIGAALIHACENVVQHQWSSTSIHNAIYTQVDECNTNAQNLFGKLGYQTLFSDPTCTNIVLDNLFVKQVTVTKCMMRKTILRN
jgi:ribosomal protein S18 acetylase RimI-like enzyme